MEHTSSPPFHVTRWSRIDLRKLSYQRLDLRSGSLIESVLGDGDTSTADDTMYHCIQMQGLYPYSVHGNAKLCTKLAQDVLIMEDDP
jgi:hypothetical protein